jgi:hypothetical protein
VRIGGVAAGAVAEAAARGGSVMAGGGTFASGVAPGGGGGLAVALGGAADAGFSDPETVAGFEGGGDGGGWLVWAPVALAGALGAFDGGRNQDCQTAKAATITPTATRRNSGDSLRAVGGSDFILLEGSMDQSAGESFARKARDLSRASRIQNDGRRNSRS